MKLVVQRVSSASVTVDGRTVGEIDKGFLILLGVAEEDTKEDAITLAKKVAVLRVFPNDEGKMDRSLLDIDGEALVVSQFTLYGDCSKGRRPNFQDAASPGHAEEIYETFCSALYEAGIRRVATGEFGAAMRVTLCNEGPVTLILES